MPWDAINRLTGQVEDLVELNTKMRRTVHVLAVICAVLVGLLVYTFLRGESTRREVHTVLQSPCQQHPSGAACRHLRESVLKHDTLRLACIDIMIAGYVCPAPAVNGQRGGKHPHPLGQTSPATGAGQGTVPSVPSTGSEGSTPAAGETTPSGANGNDGGGGASPPSHGVTGPSGPHGSTGPQGPTGPSGPGGGNGGVNICVRDPQLPVCVGVKPPPVPQLP